MNKILKYLLIGIGIILIVVVVVPFLGGFFSTFNPGGAVKKAQQAKSLSALKVAVSQKLQLSAENLEIVIDKQDEKGDYAVGTLTNSDNSEKYWWVAVNSLNPDSNQKRWWIIAAGDSKSVVTCDSVNKINFPTDLVPACLDQQSQQLVKR